ncbi:MAG: universal stress protein [Clostridia bacterium]|nr:universal stress protein [Clostridia bacterium]
MVCVTQQKSCERLIERGATLNDSKHGQLFVVHVVKENWKYFGSLKESDALEYLFDVSKEHGGELHVMKSHDIESTLNAFAEKNKIDIVVMGESLEQTVQQNMIKRLQNKATKEIHFDIVPLSYEETVNKIV